jgi:hypothetical protein
VDEDLPLKKAADLMGHLKLDQACVKTHILTYTHIIYTTHIHRYTHTRTHTHTLYSCHIRNRRLTYRYSTVLTALLYYTILSCTIHVGGGDLFCAVRGFRGKRRAVSIRARPQHRLGGLCVQLSTVLRLHSVSG